MQLYLTMPKPGETIREGVVIQWFKKPGDRLEEKEPLVELETEKAVFTYESPFRGTLKEILVKDNETAAVGTKIALFEVSEEDGQRYLMLGVGIPVDQKIEEVGATLRGRPEIKGQPRGAAPTKQSISYSPLIRNLSKEHGLSQEELDKIPRSDPKGRLTKEEVLEYLQNKSAGGAGPVLAVSPGSPRSVSYSPAGRRGAPSSEATRSNYLTDFELLPLSPIRQRIAQHMQKSHANIPQAASSVDVDFSEIWEFSKTQEGAFLKKANFSLTPFSFFAYAVREILKKFPIFNSHYLEEDKKASLKQYKTIHLGIAVATSKGLFNPVIHHADRLSFYELALAISQLEKKAKEGKLSVEELTGATFALNNPGARGGVRCYQIIPSPLIAIVGLNRIQRRPWVVGDSIVPRQIAVVDLSFDHRTLDGAEAIGFLEELKKFLENFPFEVVK